MRLYTKDKASQAALQAKIDEVEAMQRQLAHRVPESPEISRLQKLADEIGVRCSEISNKMQQAAREHETMLLGIGEAIYAGGNPDKLSEELARLEHRLAALKHGAEAGQAKHRSMLETLKGETDREKERMREAEFAQKEREAKEHRDARRVQANVAA